MKKIGVVIPACNEEAEIASCLQALEQAKQHFYSKGISTKAIDIQILVVLDSCTDGTAEKISSYNILTISCSYRCVGKTRDLGIQYLIEKGCDWICCTDADLVKRAEQIGLHITWSNQLRVITSSRLISRVCDGFSQFLWGIERHNLDNKLTTKPLRKII